MANQHIDDEEVNTLQDNILGEPLDPLSFHDNSVIWNHNGRIVQGPPKDLITVLQEHGDSGPDDEGYRRAWAPNDDDVLIYGQTLRTLAKSSPVARSGATVRGRSPGLTKARELYHDDDSHAAPSGGSFVNPQTPGDRRTIASVPFRIRSPRTQDEVELLRVVDEVNPRGYAEVTRRVDIAHEISIQRKNQSPGSADGLDHHENRILDSTAPVTPGVMPGDTYTAIRPQSPDFTPRFGSSLDSQPHWDILQGFLSSLRERRTRGNSLQAETPSSTRSPASSGSVNRSSSVSTISSEYSHATANSRPTSSNNRKRSFSASTEKNINAAQREWDELSDDIQGNPAKKRRISAHLARESTPNKRSRSGSFQDSPLRRKSTFSGLRLNTLTTPLVTASLSNPEIDEVSSRDYKAGSQISSRVSSFSSKLEIEGIPSISDDMMEMQANNATSAVTVDSPLIDKLPLSSPGEPAASTSPFQKTHSRTRPSRRSSTSSVTLLVPGRTRVSKSSSNSRQKATIQLPSPLAQEILDSSSSLSIETDVQPKKTQKAKAVGASKAIRRSKRINDRLSRL
ncbi:hypothetical protein G7Y79_00021g049850 [Physcia stellaris]|nr:hypothetical protein G7Y79_00021g049850 [Physcia stellaris]